jgi:WD40 repeat protein
VIQQVHTGSIRRAAVSRSDLLATLSTDGSIRIWDIRHAALVSVIHRTQVTDEIAWDGDSLVVGDVLERTSYDARGRPINSERRPGGLFLKAVRGYLPEQLERDFRKNVYLLPGHETREFELGIEPGGVWNTLESIKVDDSRRIVAAKLSLANVLLLWNLSGVATKAEIINLSTKDPTPLGFLPFALSPDGAHLVAATTQEHGSRIELRSTQPIELLRTREFGPMPTDVVYSSDGRRITIAGYEGVEQLDAETLASVWKYGRQTFDPVKGSFFDGHHETLTYTADARWIVASRSDGGIDVLDASTGRLRSNLGGELRAPKRISFADANTLIVVARDHVTVWSIADARPLVQLGVDRVAQAFVVGGDLITMHQANCYGVKKLRLFLDRWRGFEPPDELVRTFYDGSSYCTDIKATPGSWRSFPVRRGAYAGVHDYSTTDLTEWIDVDLKNSRALAQVSKAGQAHYSVFELTRSSVDETGVTAGHEQQPVFVGHYRLRGGWLTAELTPTMLAGKGLGVWDPRTGKLVAHLVHKLKPKVPLGEAYAISDDGLSAAVSYGTGGTVFSLPEGKPLWTFEHSTSVSALAIASDVVVVGGRDGSVATWRRGKGHLEAQTGGGKIAQVTIAPNRQLAAVGGADGVVWLWQLSDGAIRGGIVEFADDEYLVFSPAGTFAGTVEAASRVRWIFADPLEPFEFEQFAQVFRQPELIRSRMGGKAEPRAEPVLRRPPRVSLAEAPLLPTANTVSIRVHVQSQARVDRVRAFVDGRPVADDLVCLAAGDVPLTLPLLPGLNRVSLVAYDDQGLASNPLDFDVQSNAPANPPRLWVVAIGVSRYPGLEEGDLDFADDDATAVAARFAAMAGPGKRYAKVDSQVLLDEKATASAVLHAIERLANMNPEDTAVIFLAGHGVKREHGDMVFLTNDYAFRDGKLSAGTIGWTQLSAAIARARGRVVVLLDACHSGHMGQDVLVPNDALAAALVGDRRTGAIIFAASKGRQLSYEGRGARALVLDGQRKTAAGSVGHGNFTHAVLQSLDDVATDGNGDGVIHMSELTAAVTARVHKVSRGRQTPWVASREILGDFAIADTRR